jgi:putative CocE/NonD family hydrolase
MRNFRFFAFLLCAGLAAYSADKFDVRKHYTKFEYRIPMRDGVRLFTAVYVPKDSSARYPILLTRTPYGIAPYGADKYPAHLGPSDKFAEDKFIFVYQDARGRYMSEGTFVDDRPIRNSYKSNKDVDESTDAYDTIDWLIRKIPNNGKVGVYGISYGGFYTDAALVHAHPAVIAASPQAPMADLYMGDDAYHNGAFFLAANFDFYQFFNKQNNPERPQKEKHSQFDTKDGFKFYLNMGPLAESNIRYFHPPNEYWEDQLRHTTYDDYWKTRNILPHLKNVTPAVLVVGGWFDAEDLSGTLKTFCAIRAQSPGTVERLVMGPWFHGGWSRSPGNKLGDISFGSNTSEFFSDEIELPFFQHYLKGAPDPALPKAYVFETGKNAWKKQEQWPPSNTRPACFYFHANGVLSRQAPAELGAFDEYVSDPDNPVPFFAKPTFTMEREYMDADQRFVRKRPDVLTYQTAPLPQDVTVAGPISATLFVSTTGTDSDFDVKVIDVYPDDMAGRLAAYEQLVRGEPFRGKFRNGFETPERFQPGEKQEIRFAMPDVYHCFQRGHRIMVQVQSSWFPLTDRNPQSFSYIPAATKDAYVKATERIFRSKNAASSIELNVEP